jgi:hypothetical protein
MKTIRKSLFFNPDDTDKAGIPHLLQFVLPLRLGSLEADGSNFPTLWIKAGLLERTEEELLRFLREPVEYLKTDEEFFLALPRALLIAPELLYAGNWLALYHVLPKRGQTDPNYTPIDYALPKPNKSIKDEARQSTASTFKRSPGTSPTPVNTAPEVIVSPAAKRAAQLNQASKLAAGNPLFNTGSYCRFIWDYRDGSVLRCATPTTKTKFCAEHAPSRGPL